MATLTTAWSIVNDPAHESFRRQVEMAMWRIAREKLLAGETTEPSHSLVIRVLRGDEQPIKTAIKAAATDTIAQDAYTGNGNKLSDAVVVDWLMGAWNSMAGLG